MTTRLPLGPDGWIADQVFRLALRKGFSSIGLLTTETVYAKGALRRQLLACRLQCPVPSLFERRELIYAAEIMDDDPEAAVYHLLSVARSLHERQGAQRVLVASPSYERLLAASELDPLLILGTTRLADEVRTHWESDIPIGYW